MHILCQLSVLKQVHSGFPGTPLPRLPAFGGMKDLNVQYRMTVQIVNHGMIPDRDN
jgi:hypothetical protein